MDTKTFKKWYESTPTFTYYNANPMGATKRTFRWDRGDCSIRALAKGANITWLEAFDFYYSKAREEFNAMNDGHGIRRWLVANGANWIAVKAERGKARMTAEEFALTHLKGNYVVEIANHLTAVVDGKIYDTWNCGCKCVVGYYEMENFHI